MVAFAAVAGSSSPTVCKGTVCKPYDGTSVCKGSVCKPYRSAPGRTEPPIGSAVSCPSAYVVDGDTLRCGRERIRLLGIDAPEIERCPRWRVCAPGDGEASKRTMIAALQFGPIRYEPVTVDRYGRQVAVVWAGRVNLSCWQLQHGQAIYKPMWDNGRLIDRACR